MRSFPALILDATRPSVTKEASEEALRAITENYPDRAEKSKVLVNHLATLMLSNASIAFVESLDFDPDLKAKVLDLMRQLG